MNRRLKDIFMADDCQDRFANAQGLAETASSHCLHESMAFLMDECRDEQTSLEMLSVAVESLESMKRQSGGCFKNTSNNYASTDSQRLFSGDVSVETRKGCTNKLTATKSSRESDDNDSSVIDCDSKTNAEFEGKEHVLNMLCELAAAQQQEPEVPRIPKPVTLCMTNTADNVTGGVEPGNLHVVGLSRKQMGRPRSLTGSARKPISEKVSKGNRDLLEGQTGKDRKLSMPLTAVNSTVLGVATLESDQETNGTSNREPENPSMNDGVDNLNTKEVKDSENYGGSFKETIGEVESSFVVGDLVWAKVKSHPWWPGQIFDASDASLAAKKIQKPGRILVAFFGDGTFGWLQHSQLIPFFANFSEKVNQTTMKSFCRAVVEAMDEVSRHMELRLKCSHSGDALYRPNVFPDLNAGIRKGVRQSSCPVTLSSADYFQPERVLTFVRNAACSPLYPLSSGLEYSKLCGQFYGFRSFWLSPKRPQQKISLLKTPNVQAQKKGKPMLNSMSKRKDRRDESVGDLCTVEGADVKRLHVSADERVEDFSAVGTVLSRKPSSKETFLSTETEEPKASEQESKIHERGQGSFLLAKGKAQLGASDCKQKKRVGGLKSLESVRDAQKARSELTLHTPANFDDDNRTLFDITGYHSLKRKRKRASESTIGLPVQAIDSKLPGDQQEILQKEGSANFDESRKAESDFPGCVVSSSSIPVPLTCPCLPPAEADVNAEEKGNGYERSSFIPKCGDRVCVDTETISEYTRPLKYMDTACEGKQQVHMKDAVAGREEVKVEGGDDSTKDWRKGEIGHVCAEEYLDLKDTNVLGDTQLGQESVATKMSRVENNDKQDGNQPGLCADNAEESLKEEVNLTCLVREEPREKIEIEHVDTSDLDQGGEMGLVSCVGRQMKRLHSHTVSTLKSIKKQKRGVDMHNSSKILSSSVLKHEELKSAKSSKIGASEREVAQVKIGPAQSKPVSISKSKDDFSAYTVKIESNKGSKKLKLDHSLLKRQLSAVRNQLNERSLNISLPRLLSMLQGVATDPLSSANMRNSLGVVMSAFLKYRNMVFVKSSGYTTGKVVPPTVHDHTSSDKKTGDEARYVKRLHTSEVRRIRLQVSSNEAKVPLKVEFSSGNIAGARPENLAEDESSGDAKAVESLSQIVSPASQKCYAPIVGENEITRVDTAEHVHATSSHTERSCLHDLSVTAQKKKSEVLPESACKVRRESETLEKGSEKLVRERDVDPRHRYRREKHYVSRAEALSLSEKNSPMKCTANAKVALGLFMQFPEDYLLPTETELREVFSKFGTRETGGIRVYKNASTAQVVFKHKEDAEAAWQHARKNRMFGQANVTYRLRHFSLSSKNISKIHRLTSVKKGLLETKQSIQNLRRSHLTKHTSAPTRKGFSLPTHLSAGESSLSRAHSDKRCIQAQERSSLNGSFGYYCGPMPEALATKDCVVSKSSPGALKVEQALVSQMIIPNEPEILPMHISARDSLLRKADNGAGRVPELSPTQMDPVSISDPALQDTPASRLQLTIPVSSCFGTSLSSSDDLVGSFAPSVMHPLEAMHSSTQNVSSTSPLSVFPRNGSPGDIQDEMMKLLQQVSVIVSSTALSHKST